MTVQYIQTVNPETDKLNSRKKYEFIVARTALGAKIRFHFCSFKKNVVLYICPGSWGQTELFAPTLSSSSPNVQIKWLLEEESFLYLIHIMRIMAHEIMFF